MKTTDVAKMTHAELQKKVTVLCKTAGLLWHHSPDSRKEGAGWPDLVIIGPRGILYRELKTEDGRLTVRQRRTGSLIMQAGGNWAVWRPQDWADGTIARQLNAIAAVVSSPQASR